MWAQIRLLRKKQSDLGQKASKVFQQMTEQTAFVMNLTLRAIMHVTENGRYLILDSFLNGIWLFAFFFLF